MTVWNTERLLKLVIFACFLMVAAFGFLYKQQMHLDTQLKSVDDKLELLEDAQTDLEFVQTDAAKRAVLTRAIACRLEYALLLEPSEVCFTDEVLQYWDPEDSSSPHFENPESP